MNVRWSFPLLAVACNPVLLAPSEVGPGGDGRSVLDGTPEAVGVLAFLNDVTTDVPVLDLTVGLDVRAARNLVAHRDGADRVFGTGDDDPFGGIDEVDAVRQVGPATLDTLFSWVAANGWIPEGDAVLGTWDGVTFTVDQAEATLDRANSATFEELDVDLALDRRAADSIVAAQPIPSVFVLSELPWVGRSALTILRNAASAATVDCWVDADGDGWGAEPVVVPGNVCDGLYTAVSGDCDDVRADVHPGQYDLCDGVDGDCDPETTDIGADVNGALFLLLPDAIAAASAGDTILVCDGGYGDPLVIDKDLTLRSLHGAGATTLDVTAMGSSAIAVVAGSLVLDGFTVSWGEGTASGGKRLGGGLYAATAGDVTVTGCVFQENYATDGGAIWHGGTGLLTLTDTLVHYGHAQGEGGGLWTSGAVVVTGGGFETNEAGSGGGIRVSGAGTVDASGVDFAGNTPDDVRTATSSVFGADATFSCTSVSCDGG